MKKTLNCKIFSLNDYIETVEQYLNNVNVVDVDWDAEHFIVFYRYY